MKVNVQANLWSLSQDCVSEFNYNREYIQPESWECGSPTWFLRIIHEKQNTKTVSRYSGDLFMGKNIRFVYQKLKWFNIFLLATLIRCYFRTFSTLNSFSNIYLKNSWEKNLCFVGQDIQEMVSLKVVRCSVISEKLCPLR